ncbi:hypothetical protein CCB80_11205 [Armatimonadetes bacterium Uphvl-Ar1]|nr:hypothetical protein CCB80_11205 [Armatimonadetes bacterium Uphvl-Ar1]
MGEDLGGGHQIEPTTSKVFLPSPDGEGKGWGDQTRFSPDLESAPPTPLGKDLGGGIKNETPNSHTTNSDFNLENLPQSPSAHASKSEDPSLKLIPAVYNGPDIEAVAYTLNLTIEELIQIHSHTIYTVEAIGFCPGFPYLAGLPQPLQNLPRKSTPRTAVEPGSIGITGDQCCIYPLARPGGWNLIAQTPLTLVDPDSSYFPLQVGDKIQFQPITNSQFQELKNKRL